MITNRLFIDENETPIHSVENSDCSSVESSDSSSNCSSGSSNSSSGNEKNNKIYSKNHNNESNTSNSNIDNNNNNTVVSDDLSEISSETLNRNTEANKTRDSPEVDFMSPKFDFFGSEVDFSISDFSELSDVQLTSTNPTINQTVNQTMNQTGSITVIDNHSEISSYSSILISEESSTDDCAAQTAQNHSTNKLNVVNSSHQNTIQTDNNEPHIDSDNDLSDVSQSDSEHNTVT